MSGTPAPHRLSPVRKDFNAALADIDSDGVGALRQRVQQALSLRELWHLRADIFRTVGLAHSQAEAERRLAALNRHFPTRTPRAPGSAP